MSKNSKTVKETVPSPVSSAPEASSSSDTEKGPSPESLVDKNDCDPDVVDWSGPNDPANPLNWSATVKWSNLVVVCAMTFWTGLASVIFAPGVPDVNEDFRNTNNALSSFVVSVYMLGCAAAPLAVAPLSELYGRLIVYHVCNVLAVAWTVACALATNMASLIVFRFFAGCSGVVMMTNGGGTIADLIVVEQRGRAMALWLLGPLLGPVVGPVCGGFIAEALGWRWIFWVFAMASGATVIAAFAVLRETYAPVLLERKARRLRKETGNTNLRSRLDPQLPTREYFLRAIMRPAKFMTQSVTCVLMILYGALIYGVMYLLYTTFPFVFVGSYGFSQSAAGLVYISVGIGLLLGLAIHGATSDRLMKRLAEKHSKGELKPEYRLPMMIWFGPLMPIGLFIYGWAAENRIQWAAPLLGTLLFGVGLIVAFMCINTYLVDAYTRYAASAMAANAILRSIFGATIPIFGLQMYNALGIGWGNSLLAFLSLGLCPIPWLLYRYGEKLRTHPKYRVEF